MSNPQPPDTTMIRAIIVAMVCTPYLAMAFILFVFTRGRGP
jgi:hypothetical protein